MIGNRVIMIVVGMLLMGMSATGQTMFRYEGREMVSSKERLYVSDKVKTKEKHYTFATVQEALLFVESQQMDTTTPKDWTEIYIEPSVYWLDNPDDPRVRKPQPGSATPFALEVRIDKVRMIGLSGKADDVVLAVNRGQTQGADGNYTMLHITGSDIEAENITFGNYCNVDLVYQRNPAMNHGKRKEAIVQAQLAIAHGDRYRMKNCRFISRLNLCPFVGPRHVDFENCYFECTDDALCGTGTYRRCRFTFFSGKPFYTTDRSTGAKFYDCDIHSKTRGTQYLTKVSGPVEMERCRWTSDDAELRIQWDKRPDPRNYCVMKECTLNGKPLDVPTPTEPLPVVLPPFEVANQTGIIPGRWTLDCYKPFDTEAYDWEADNVRGAWGYAEGVDGAEGSWGLVQLKKGARMMFTPKDELVDVTKQECTVVLDPCKGPGQGFGSATGQYLDICIKFDTRTLTGYGIRFIRTPDYDHAVETYLVEYSDGNVFHLSKPERCDLFKRGCSVTLLADGAQLKATISQGGQQQELSATMDHPNTFHGFHLQHTGSVGASATVVREIRLKP